MKQFSTIYALLISVLLLGTTISCRENTPNNESTDEATYMLVGIPCSEGDYATAISRADSLLKTQPQMSETLKAYIMIDRDVALGESGQTDRAFAYADTLIEFGRIHGIGLAVMQGLQNQGIISRRNGDWEKAISLYKEGLEIAVNEKDEEMQQVFAEMLSVACTEHELYEEATTFGKLSIKMAREMGDSLQELNAAATLSSIFVKQGEYESAITNLMPYSTLSRSARGVVRVKYLTPLLWSYIHLDSLEKAHIILKEMYEELDGLPRNTQSYLASVNAEIMLAKKERRFDDQWHWLQTADSIGWMGSPLNEIYQERAECLYELGRYKDAYKMQKKAYIALDSLRTSDNKLQLSDLMMKYDTLRKDMDISRLKAERIKLILVVIVSLLVLVIIIIVFVNKSRKAKLRLESERREEFIRGLENERQRIARELHDDIAGSLVGLQLKLKISDKYDMENELIMLNRRVRTMSHEMMPPEFSHKSFLDIVADYVKRFEGHHNSRTIEFEKSGTFDWENLSSKESHELYRIIQELVSNAMRHGNDESIRIILSGNEKWHVSIESGLRENHQAGKTEDGIGNRTLKDRADIIGATYDTKIIGDKYIAELEKI